MMSSVLLLLMWSCSSDNDAPENGEEVPILLSSSFSSATRAGHEDEIDPEATAALRNFWVYGYKTVAGNDIQMMNKQLVSRDAAGSPWTYSPLKYWDRAASNYLFVGYTPNNGVSINNDTKVLSFSQIPQWQPYSPENDYMVATSTNSPGYYLSSANLFGAGYVHLDFTHILSKLTIKAYCPSNSEEGVGNVQYQVKRISLGSYGWWYNTTGGVRQESHGLPPEKKDGNTYTLTGTYNYTKDFTSDSRVDSDNPKISYYELSEASPQESVDLFKVTDDKDTKLISPYQGSATEVCSWLIAPFRLSDMGYEKNDVAGVLLKDACFTLDVTYVSKKTQFKEDSTTETEDVYTEMHTSQPVRLVSTAEDGTQTPYFDSFEYNKEYIITLRIDRAAIEVLVDVAITPWNTTITGASSRDVYNW